MNVNKEILKIAKIFHQKVYGFIPTKKIPKQWIIIARHHLIEIIWEKIDDLEELLEQFDNKMEANPWLYVHIKNKISELQSQLSSLEHNGGRG